MQVGRHCKTSSRSFFCTGVLVADGVFIGHGVMFINDLYPQAVNPDGSLQTEANWRVVETRVKGRASMRGNAWVTIGEGALVAAGAVATRDVPDYDPVMGVPARLAGDVRERRSPRPTVAWFC